MKGLSCGWARWIDGHVGRAPAGQRCTGRALIISACWPPVFSSDYLPIYLPTCSRSVGSGGA